MDDIGENELRTPCSLEGIEWSLEAEDFASFVLLRFGRGLLGSTSDGLCVKAAGRLAWVAFGTQFRGLSFSHLVSTIEPPRSPN